MRAEAVRRAALHLHALGHGDRQWILAQLDDDQRREITACLAELRHLGIPADPSLVREAASPREPAAQSLQQTTAIGQALVDRIDRLPVPALVAALAAEPDAVVAALVGLHPWSWRTDFLDFLDPDSRLRIESAQGDLPVAAALGDALMAALLQRTASASIGECPTSTSPGDQERPAVVDVSCWWRKVRSWLD